jgi:FlaA1/EpsC-like NDP-sugar epimerase
MRIFDNLLSWYFKKDSLPYWCIFIIDSVIVFLSGIFTYWIFNKTQVLIEHRFDLIYTTLIYVMFSWVGFRVFHTYSGIIRFSSFVDLMRVAYGSALSLVIALIYSFVMEQQGLNFLSILTQTETVITFVIATLVMWAERIVVKTLYDVSFSDSRALRVLIYGAKTGGIGLAKSINTQRPRRFVVRGFISHDDKAKHILLMGRKVYNVSDNLESIIKKERIEAILVSPLRNRDFQKNQKLQDLFISKGVKIFMASNAKEWKDGDDDYTDVHLKEVSVEDLLPREEIRVDMKSVGEMLKDKCVFITGSAGSIGSEMVRQVAHFKPSSMILIDQAETPQHDIRLMMNKDFPDVKAEVIVTSISRVTRMDALFRKYRPDYVFHAAAYKHVPMMEDNPSEAVLNNIYGTKVIADLSVKYGVKKFVMISTDKAVNPTNVMGCSKRICEIYVQSLDREQKIRQLRNEISKGEYTQFVTTRFGNVLGSNGSVIPLFKEQIRNGGPVTVTDKRIVRFFMLIPEACKLVLEAGTKGNGGEIFVFDMGQPVKIAELAQRMIQLSGAKNVEIKYTGLRPGEKLYEEVLNDLEGTKPTFHEKIRIAEVREYDFAQVSKDIDELVAISKNYDDMVTVKKMKEIVPEYKSNNSVYEELDKEEN